MHPGAAGPRTRPSEIASEVRRGHLSRSPSRGGLSPEFSVGGLYTACTPAAHLAPPRPRPSAAAAVRNASGTTRRRWSPRSRHGIQAGISSSWHPTGRAAGGQGTVARVNRRPILQAVIGGDQEVAARSLRGPRSPRAEVRTKQITVKGRPRSARSSFPRRRRPRRPRGALHPERLVDHLGLVFRMLEVHVDLPGLEVAVVYPVLDGPHRHAGSR